MTTKTKDLLIPINSLKIIHLKKHINHKNISNINLLKRAMLLKKTFK